MMAELEKASTYGSLHETAIDLADNTSPVQDRAESSGDASLDGLSPTSRTTTRTFKGTGGKLREELARRKYAKYAEDRYKFPDAETHTETRTNLPLRTDTSRSLRKTATAFEEVGGDIETANRPRTVTQGSRLTRGRDRVRDILGMKRRLPTGEDGDSAIDILFENQRGVFVFGIPHYSSQSLLNFDPDTWTTADGKPSPVDVTNAQLPDPTWEWAWKTWYVDMSPDVDEHGWQYSFSFGRKFSWHGSHPLFTSFVRRRRWIRKRRRTHLHSRISKPGEVTMGQGHHLNADYFTIHPAHRRQDRSSVDSGIISAQESVASAGEVKPDEDSSDEINSITLLLQKLRESSVDREKISVTLQYIDQDQDDVQYLADEIPHILSFLLYQYSRRNLLAAMTQKVDSMATSQPSVGNEVGNEVHVADVEQSGLEGSKPPKDNERRRENLLKAIEATDEQVRNLEFWSDIKAIVREGESIGAKDEDRGWDEGWQGVDASGPRPRLRVDDKAGDAASVSSTGTTTKSRKGKERATN